MLIRTAGQVMTQKWPAFASLALAVRSFRLPGKKNLVSATFVCRAKPGFRNFRLFEVWKRTKPSFRNFRLPGKTWFPQLSFD